MVRARQFPKGLVAELLYFFFSSKVALRVLIFEMFSALLASRESILNCYGAEQLLLFQDRVGDRDTDDGP